MAMVSEEEIEREVRTLRNLRRRSASSPGPGALPVDPDLPPPTTPQKFSSDDLTSSSSSSSSSPVYLNYPVYSSNDDITLSLSTPDGLDGNDNGMFWVPAHLHPELAPGEFRAFLKQHTAIDPETAVDGAGEAGEAPGLARSPSWLARNNSRKGGLGRKKSMLSRQYHPTAGDHVEDEQPPVPSRQGANGGRTGEKGLTLKDLQKLEEIVEGSDMEGDPALMRRALRRSLSMNVAPGFLEETVNGNETDEPIMSSNRPSSIVRRSGRTKIRKSSVPGEFTRRLASSRKNRASVMSAMSSTGGQIDDHLDDEERRKSSDASDEQQQQQQQYPQNHYLSNQYRSVSPDKYHQTSPEFVAEDEEEDSGAREQWSDAVQHLEHRRSSDASTDEAMIFESYSREDTSGSGVTVGSSDEYGGDRVSTSSVSSSANSSYDQSRSPSPEETSSNEKLGPSTLPPIVTPKQDEAPWFSGTDGETTPTQESIRDPLHDVKRPSPVKDYESGKQQQRPTQEQMMLGGVLQGSQAGQGQEANSHLGMSLQVPLDPLRPISPPLPTGGSQSIAPSPTRADQMSPTSPTTPATPQQRPVPLPHNPDPPTAHSDLPPGMAPPQQRSAIPPGIAMQQKTGHIASVPDRPSLARTESNQSSSSAAPSVKGKEKEKKGGLFSKKRSTDKETKEMAAVAEGASGTKSSKKEKDRFLGSLFGGKKKHEETSSVSNFSTAGPAAAAALLGTSKSAKSLGLTPGNSATPSPTSPGFHTNSHSPYARYPIHVERAIYRLSHIKLANARRPLIEQVLISNLMFWYLGLIGRTANGGGDGEEEGTVGVDGAGMVAKKKKTGLPNGLDEKREEQREPQLKGTPPRALDVGQAGIKKPESPPYQQNHYSSSHPQQSQNHIHQLLQSPQRTSSPPLNDRSLGGPAGSEAFPSNGSSSPSPSPRKSGLSKPERSRATGQSSEAAVRSPQYGMQNAQMDKEMMRGSGGGGPMSPTGSGVGHLQQQHQMSHGSPHGNHVPNGLGPLSGQGQGSPQRQMAMSPPPSGPMRTLSPPTPGQQQQQPIRPMQPNPHQQVQPLPGGQPQQNFDELRDVPRPRTLSQPSPGGPPGGQLPHPNQGAMRRIVTDGHLIPSQQQQAPPPQYSTSPNHPPLPQQQSLRPQQHLLQPPLQPGSPIMHRASSSASSPGPQPGQIFQYPGSPGVQPGQPFPRPPGSPGMSSGMGTQPGQIFHHPQFPQRPPPPPSMQPGVGGPGSQWEPPQRLPPGAGSPYLAAPVPPQQLPPGVAPGSPRRVSPSPNPNGPEPGGHFVRPPYPQNPQAHIPLGQQVYYARPSPPPQQYQQGQALPPPQGYPYGVAPGQIHPGQQHHTPPPGAHLGRGGGVSQQGMRPQPVPPVGNYPHHR